jgi:hypothetical protein
MESALRKTFIVVAIIWLVLVFGMIIFGLCNVVCQPGGRCGCAISDGLYYFAILGIPSWILFLIVLLSGLKKKPRTRR